MFKAKHYDIVLKNDIFRYQNQIQTKEINKKINVRRFYYQRNSFH